MSDAGGWAGMASQYTILDDDGTVLWRGPIAELRRQVLASPAACVEVERAGYRRWLGGKAYRPDATAWTGYVPPRMSDRGKYHVEANPSPTRRHLLAAVRLAFGAAVQAELTDDEIDTPTDRQETSA